MKYKRLLPVLPFILLFFVLSFVVEMNVIAEYSVVTVVNRLLVPIVGVTCVTIAISKWSVKWAFTIIMLALIHLWRLWTDITIGRNFYKNIGEDHGTYWTSVLFMGLIMLWAIVIDVTGQKWNKNNGDKVVTN